MTTQIDPSVISDFEAIDSEKRSLTYHQLILCSVVIGIVGGLVATVYYFILEGMMHGAWHTLPALITPYFPSWLTRRILCAVCDYNWWILCWFGAVLYGSTWRNGSGGRSDSQSR